MTEHEKWDEFVQVHGAVVGYLRVIKDAAALGRPEPLWVYSPRSEP